MKGLGTSLLKYGSLPKHSEIFHKYASSVFASVVSHKDRSLILEYKIKIEDATRPWGCAIEGEKIETYLVDEILDRLDKMDRERQYCNRFSKEIYTIDSIRAKIAILDDYHEEIVTIVVPDLRDVGYPDKKSTTLKEQLKEYCGSALQDRLITHKAGE